MKLGVFAVIFGDNTFYLDKTKVGIYAEKLDTYKKIHRILKKSIQAFKTKRIRWNNE
jgi:hypothetical protein